MSKDEILKRIKETLVETFDIEEALIRPSALIYQDLDLDSIDAIDLVIKLQDLTGEKIKPEQFKSIRTVADMVDAVYKMLQEA